MPTRQRVMQIKGTVREKRGVRYKATSEKFPVASQSKVVFHNRLPLEALWCGGCKMFSYSPNNGKCLVCGDERR